MPDPCGTFLYFAYGSNMLTRRLVASTPSATPVGIAYLEGYRLTFDKASRDGSGKCDIEATGDRVDRVWGALFWIATADAANLDEAEGLGHGYRKGEVRVMTKTARIRQRPIWLPKKTPGACLTIGTGIS
jgi:hypothetical protein